MADRIFSGQTPAGLDFDGLSHSWGMKFTVSANGSCVGGRAWVPAAGRPTTFKWQLWRVGDATKIAESNLNDAAHGTPSNGAWMLFGSNLFVTPGNVSLDTAQTYIVCVHFAGGDGVSTDNGTETFPVGVGVVSSSTGRFSNGNNENTMPATDYVAYFFADVEVESGPATVALTPAVVSLSAPALTPLPGPVTVNLTAAAASLGAQPLSAMPGAVTVNLTPAVVILGAVPFANPEPGNPTPSGTSPTLTPAGVSPILTPSGTSPVLTPSGKP